MSDKPDESSPDIISRNDESEIYLSLVRTIVEVQAVPEDVVIAFLNSQGSFFINNDKDEKQN